MKTKAERLQQVENVVKTNKAAIDSHRTILLRLDTRADNLEDRVDDQDIEIECLASQLKEVQSLLGQSDESSIYSPESLKDQLDVLESNLDELTTSFDELDETYTEQTLPQLEALYHSFENLAETVANELKKPRTEDKEQPLLIPYEDGNSFYILPENVAEINSQKTVKVKKKPNTGAKKLMANLLGLATTIAGSSWFAVPIVTVFVFTMVWLALTAVFLKGNVGIDKYEDTRYQVIVKTYTSGYHSFDLSSQQYTYLKRTHPKFFV